MRYLVDVLGHPDADQQRSDDCYERVLTWTWAGLEAWITDDGGHGPAGVVVIMQPTPIFHQLVGGGVPRPGCGCRRRKVSVWAGLRGRCATSTAGMHRSVANCRFRPRLLSL